LPKKPSFKEKLWVRTLIVSFVLVLLAAVLTFWYWYLVIRKQAPASPAPSFPETTSQGEIVIPPPLFVTNESWTITISQLSQAIQSWQNNSQFVRLVLENDQKNKALSLEEFFQAMAVEAPDELFQKLGNDLTLFVYSQKEGKRLGFAAEVVDKNGLADLLKKQEGTMENDYKTIFSLMGKENPAIIPYFRDASGIKEYKGPNFRYKTLIADDLGICYFISDDYFIFTSSWQSMEEVLKRLGYSI